MFLLPSIAVGLLLAVFLGGRPSRLQAVDFRRAWTVIVALGIQFVLFSPLTADVPEPVVEAVHLGTYALLGLFAVANRHIRALAPILLGLTLNALAIVANGGRMPASAAAARAAGIDHLTNISTGATHLRFLGDVFALPGQLPLANVFSIGDILIGLGVIAFIVLVAVEDEQGERSLDVRRLLLPFRTRDFRLLSTGKLVSTTGDWLTLSALIGWIYQSTHSTTNVAAFLLVRLAPPILGGGLAAFVVDRLPKQRLLVWIEAARGLVVACALVGVVADSRLVVLLSLACSGILAAVSSATAPALLPSLLPADRLPAANAAIGIARDLAMAVGALGAGVALSFAAPTTALGIDLATFAVAVALFSLLRAPAAPPPAVLEPAQSTNALRYLLRSRGLLLLVLSFAFATIATGLTNATLPRFLGAHGFGAGGYGFGLGALAAGLALGQTLVGFARVGPSGGRWIGAGLVIMAGLFVLLGLTDHPATALLLIGAIGFVDGTTDVIFETVIQREADPRHLGAVFGLASASITTTMLGAVALAPLMNRVLDPEDVIVTASLFLLAAGAIALVRFRRPMLAAVAGTAAGDAA
jgi:hypothetical protein